MDDLHLDDERAEEPTKKVWGLAIAILAILAVVAILYYFFFMKKPEAPAAPAATAIPSAAPAEGEKAPAVTGVEPLAFPAVSLGDERCDHPGIRRGLVEGPGIRQVAALKGPHPEIRRLRRQRGQRAEPEDRTSISSARPATSASPGRRAGSSIDPAAYSRYDAVVGVALSMEAAAAARLYRAVEPLLQEAYNELGYPGVDFDDTLVRAMSELLETPVVEGPIRLEQKVLSYAMTDPDARGLEPGPETASPDGPEGSPGRPRQDQGAGGRPGDPAVATAAAEDAYHGRRARPRRSLPAEGLVLPEIGDEVLVRPERLRLEEQVIESEGQGLVGRPPVFLRGHAPLDLLRRPEAGMVLAHQAQADVGREVLPDPFQEDERVVDRARAG